MRSKLKKKTIMKQLFRREVIDSDSGESVDDARKKRKRKRREEVRILKNGTKLLLFKQEDTNSNNAVSTVG